MARPKRRLTVTCGLCERRDPPVFSEMIVRHEGCAPICPACDRLCCGRCKTLLLAGDETRCPNCRAGVRKMLSEP